MSRDTSPDSPLKGLPAEIHASAVVEEGVLLGEGTRVGYFALIRRGARVGSHVLIGSATILDGEVKVGDYTKIQSRVYLPRGSRIGSRVFIGPGAIFTNDRWPLRRPEQYKALGPVVGDDAVIGAGAILLPGIHIGEGAFVGAGAIVTGDVPPWHLAVGIPARATPLPDSLMKPNQPKELRIEGGASL